MHERHLPLFGLVVREISNNILDRLDIVHTIQNCRTFSGVRLLIKVDQK